MNLGVLGILWSESSSPDVTGVWKPRTVVAAGMAAVLFMVRRVCAQHRLEFGIGCFGVVSGRLASASGAGKERKWLKFDWFPMAFATVFVQVRWAWSPVV